MSRKKRRKIASLLEYYSKKEDRVRVLIKGEVSGLVLFDGRIWDVPFGLSSDYVLNYRYAAGLLEIISSCSPFCGD